MAARQPGALEHALHAAEAEPTRTNEDLTHNTVIIGFTRTGLGYRNAGRPDSVYILGIPHWPIQLLTNYAVGRYAYAVYDEGGLLDMNVAGYPTSTGANPTVTDIGRKGVLAFADLTALPTNSGQLP